MKAGLRKLSPRVRGPPSTNFQQRGLPLVAALLDMGLLTRLLEGTSSGGCGGARCWLMLVT